MNRARCVRWRWFSRAVAVRRGSGGKRTRTGSAPPQVCGAGPAARTPPGHLLEMHIPHPLTLDLLNLKSRGWGQQCIDTSPPGGIPMLAEDFVILVPLPSSKQFAVTVFGVSHVCFKGLILHAKITEVLPTG